jgi:transposase-like protein
VEIGEGAFKLIALKNRLIWERVVAFFRSPEDLRGHVFEALIESRNRYGSSIHYATNIPSPPDSYIAHPYTLLQNKNLIGWSTTIISFHRRQL